MQRALRLVLALTLFVALAAGGRFLLVGSAVGAGFAAHVTCSLVFVSGQSAERAFDEYVQYQIWPLGFALSLDVGEREVVASVLGVERARARYEPGAGCTQLHPDAPVLSSYESAPSASSNANAEWPLGEAGPREPAPAAVEAAIDRAFAEPDAANSQHRVTKAVLIARDGRLVAERYADGVAAHTPLISWSMAKSVLATLVGVAVAQERMKLAAPAPVADWSGVADARASITLDQLLRMSSGLSFEERYGPSNEASVMLFARSDAARFAAERPLDAAPDTVWNYSSGTSNLVSRLLADAVAPGRGHSQAEALRAWARANLFARIGAHSALAEADASGTLIFSSFAYMTARDWARLGELHRNDGVWRGERVLPAGWVEYVTTPTPPSHGEYGAHWWLNRGTFADPQTPVWPDLPRDAFAARGHSGQYVLVIPSEKLVVVRLGLTSPSGPHDGAAELAQAVVAHYRTAGAR